MEPRINQLYHQPVHLPTNKVKENTSVSSAFKEVLTKVEGVKVSRHAEERISERNISINQKQWNVINEKVGEAREKGIKDSLVVTQKAALLVSIENNTVVTVMDRQEATNKIFTNINGTILIEE